MLGDVLKVAIAVAAAIVIFRIGFMLLRGLATPMPEPPPPGEMRKVNIRYRCSVCGTELKMTAAPDEDPPPPRHCQEEMTVVAPTFE